ncbi:MAG: helix-turn-helix domain-containing protein [Phycisphaerae bacterium]|jgi:AraC-like DNA-binding protein
MINENSTKTNLPDYGVLIESRQKRLASVNIAHKHDNPSILFVVYGQGVLEFDDKSFSVESNSVIILPKDKSHKLSDKPRKQMTILSVYFDIQKTGLNKHIVDYLLESAEPFILPLYYSENIKRYLRQMLYEQNTKPPGYKLSITQNLSLAILQIYRAILKRSKQKISSNPPGSSERVKSVIDFISQNCHEQYSLADAARLGKVSQRQFTNLCRNLTGISFIKFLNSVRCKKAAQLLKQTNMSAAAVAFEVGYEDLSTFYRAFKGIYKSSPIRFKTSVEKQTDINQNGQL